MDKQLARRTRVGSLTECQFGSCPCKSACRPSDHYRDHLQHSEFSFGDRTKSQISSAHLYPVSGWTSAESMHIAGHKVVYLQRLSWSWLSKYKARRVVITIGSYRCRFLRGQAAFLWRRRLHCTDQSHGQAVDLEDTASADNETTQAYSDRHEQRRNCPSVFDTRPRLNRTTKKQLIISRSAESSSKLIVL